LRYEENFGFAKKCRFVLAFLVYAGANMLLVMLAAMLCVYIGPSAAGSGIPEVKAYLNGVDTPHVFSLNTLVVKVRECLSESTVFLASLFISCYQIRNLYDLDIPSSHNCDSVINVNRSLI
jgi:hypothetical protein